MLQTTLGKALLSTLVRSEPEPTPEGITEPHAELYPTPESYPEVTTEPHPELNPTPESFPEASPSPESNPEVSATAESYPEFFSTPESYPEIHPIPEGEDVLKEKMTPAVPEPGAFAEPVPNWDEALEVWGPAWPAKIYILGSLFALLAIFALANMIQLCRLKGLKSRSYFLALNALMFVLGFTRTIFMFVDAYSHKDTFPQAVTYFLISLSLPCLTSAFYILFSALLKATKLQNISPKLYDIRLLIGIIAFNFILSFTGDMVVGFIFDARILLMVCQGVYVMWGLVFSIAYVVLFQKLYKSTVLNRRSIQQITQRTHRGSSGVFIQEQGPNNQNSRKTNLAIKVTLATSMFFFIITGLNLYGMVSEFSIMTTETPDPWSWWIYQLAFRFCEFCMASTIVFVASPFRY